MQPMDGQGQLLQHPYLIIIIIEGTLVVDSAARSRFLLFPHAFLADKLSCEVYLNTNRFHL